MQLAPTDFAAVPVISEAVRFFQSCSTKLGLAILFRLYFKAGQFKTEATMQKALDFNPNYVNGWIHPGDAFAHDGNKPET